MSDRRLCRDKSGLTVSGTGRVTGTTGYQVAGKRLDRVTTGLPIVGNVTVTTGGKAAVTGKGTMNANMTNMTIGTGDNPLAEHALQACRRPAHPNVKGLMLPFPWPVDQLPGVQ